MALPSTTTKGGDSANALTTNTSVSTGSTITNYNTGTDTPPWISLGPFQPAAEIPKWIFFAGGGLILVVVFLIFRRK